MIDLSQARWRKPRRSGSNGNCVEVALNLPDVVATRDSKDQDGPALVVTRRDWMAFLSLVKK